MSMEAERERMVSEQLEGRGIEDARVLDAMRSVPRHEFVPPELVRARLRRRAAADRRAADHLAALHGGAHDARRSQLRAGRARARDRHRLGLPGGGPGGDGRAGLLDRAPPTLADAAERRLATSRLRPRARPLRGRQRRLARGGAVRRHPGHRRGARDPARSSAAAQPLGRLVLPIGDEESQKLVRVWRTEQGFKRGLPRRVPLREADRPPRLGRLSGTGQ